MATRSAGPAGPDECSVGLNDSLGPAGRPSRFVAVLGLFRCHGSALVVRRHGSGSFALLARRGADSILFEKVLPWRTRDSHRLMSSFSSRGKSP